MFSYTSTLFINIRIKEMTDLKLLIITTLGHMYKERYILNTIDTQLRPSFRWKIVGNPRL